MRAGGRGAVRRFWLPRATSSAVERAGAAALVLPAGRVVTERPELVLDAIDALVLTGGCDVDPASYGSRPQRETGPVDALRDAFEVELVRAAFARDLPVLATCRGIQVLNVAFGGTLRQHLAGGEGRTHRHRAGQFTRHRVRLAPRSLAASAAGDEHPEVDSHHHQAIERVAPNFRVSGHADDGLIEAIENPARAFALGVQWHPEDDAASTLIASLVAAARATDAGPPELRARSRRTPGGRRLLPCGLGGRATTGGVVRLR